MVFGMANVAGGRKKYISRNKILLAILGASGVFFHDMCAEKPLKATEVRSPLLSNEK